MKFFDKKAVEVDSAKVVREVIDEECNENLYAAIREVKAILECRIRNECKLSGDTDIQWEPYWGTKHTKNMDNLGYVIGLRCGHYSFRVDYDPAKGIHINYGSDNREDNYVRARKATRPAHVFSTNNNDEQYVRQIWEELSRRYRYFNGSEKYEKCRDEVMQQMKHDKIVRIY